MVLVIYGATFFSVFLLSLGLYNLVFASRFALLERLSIYTKQEEAIKYLQQKKETNLREAFFNFAGAIGKMLSRQTYLDTLKKRLLQSHTLIKPEEFLGIKLSCLFLLGFVVYLLTAAIFPALVAALLGSYIPDVYIDIKKKKRANALTMQLPEALTVISNGLRSGLSFFHALNVVTKDMEPPISDEFKRVIFENSMGKPLEEVLRNLNERTDSDVLNLLITALLIQKQVGGNLAEILDNIAHTIRERVRIKGEIRTLTATGRMSATVIFILPIAVALFILLTNRDYIWVLFTHPYGRIMLVMAIFMEIIGALFIRRIVNIDV